jgi:hypothetical protein
MVDISIVSAVVFYIAFLVTIARLQVKHKGTFDQLQIDGLIFCGSIRQAARVLDFFIKRKDGDLHDIFLSFAGWLSLASLLLAFALQFYSLLR